LASDRDAVILAGVRTPFARRGTVFRALSAADLARVAIREAIERAEIDPETVDEVVVGTTTASADSPNVARAASLLAKIPAHVPAFTVGRDGASGLEAIVEAAYRIRSGDADLVVAAAVDSMSTAPAPPAEEARRDGSGGLRAGEIAERLARDFDLSREEQDAAALRSHRLASAAWSEGRMAGEVVIVPIPPDYVSAVARDNGIVADPSAEALGALRPAFDPRFGTVTSGNASQPFDGAVALVLASAGRARALGLPSLGKVRSWGFAGCGRQTLGLGAVLATPRALRRAGGLALERMDVVELHEECAAQVIACSRALASRGFCEKHLGAGPPGALDPERVNVNGGAIAFGNPPAASGARLVLALLREMERRDASWGLVALGAGEGQGAAMVLERSP
jgi:acetyl-CoA acyltransferase